MDLYPLSVKVGRREPAVCNTERLEELTTDAEAITPDLCEHIIASILDALQLSLQCRQSISAYDGHQILTRSFFENTTVYEADHTLKHLPVTIKRGAYQHILQ